MLECGECGAEFKTRGRLMVGDVLECPECATELEVVDTDPLTVETAHPDDDDGGQVAGNRQTSREDDEDWFQ